MISSTKNDQVKMVVELRKKAKARNEAGLFVAEGLRMVSELPPDRAWRLYVSESFLKNRENAGLLERFSRYEIVTDQVFSAMSDTQTPQGILALAKQYEYVLSDLLSAPGPAHLMILENLQDPGNLGTILRAGEGAGITGVIMSRDTVDIYNPKVIRSTMGSVYRMPFVYVEHLPETLEVLAEAGIHSYAAHLKGKNSYDQEDYTRGTAFLIGNEGNGLRDEVADAAECYIKIPMCGEVESLNAAVASSVLMFEAARQRR